MKAMQSILLLLCTTSKSAQVTHEHCVFSGFIELKNIFDLHKIRIGRGKTFWEWPMTRLKYMCSIYPIPNFMTTSRVIAKTDGSSADCRSKHNTRAAAAVAQRGMDPTSASLASQNWRKCQGSSNFHFSKTWNISKHQLLKCKQLSCFNWHFLFLKQVSVWKCVVANNFLFFSTLNVNWVAASWTLNLSALRKEKSLVCSDEGGYWG